MGSSYDQETIFKAVGHRVHHFSESLVSQSSVFVGSTVAELVGAGKLVPASVVSVAVTVAGPPQFRSLNIEVWMVPTASPGQTPGKQVLY